MTTATATTSPRLAALQAYDRHVHACASRTVSTMPLDDNHQPVVGCYCPEADRLWQAVLGTPA